MNTTPNYNASLMMDGPPIQQQAAVLSVFAGLVVAAATYGLCRHIQLLSFNNTTVVPLIQE